MHLGGTLHHVFNLCARQVQGHGGQAAQFGLGIFVDDLGQRQDKQPRRVFTDQAIPARQLYVADEGAIRQHQVLVQVQSAIRTTGAARRADHQTQHAVAPAAEQVLVSLGQQIVNGIDPLRIDLPQRCLGEIVAGIEERDGFAAGVTGGGRPAEMLFVVAIQCGTAAGVARVKEEILHVDRDEFLGAAGLVDIRTAGNLAIVLFAFTPTAYVLLPAGQVEQARIVAEGKAPIGLAPTLVGHADQP
ncbi:hypothetical protein D3C81_928300 [compost metagenome]